VEIFGSIVEIFGSIVEIFGSKFYILNKNKNEIGLTTNCNLYIGYKSCS